MASRALSAATDGKRKALALAVLGALDDAVPVAGLYESAQSVSSSSVAFTEFVTVIGRQVKSLASSGSSNSVAVVVTRVMDAVVIVKVSVIMIASQKLQVSSVPQYW
jgi:hypothetical protein